LAVKQVLRMGEPLLLQLALPVEVFDTPELHALIQDMQDTMQAMNGAGIAAPQIGVSLQVVIFGQKELDGTSNPRYPDADSVPYTVLINPTLNFVGDEIEDGWEGCLSVPGLRGVVPRYMRLHYTGSDQYGNLIDRMVSGFHARVVQHECDHLLGILYPMRINDLRQFGYTDVLFSGQNIVDD
jgi:peptide deformylase